MCSITDQSATAMKPTWVPRHLVAHQLMGWIPSYLISQSLCYQPRLHLLIPIPGTELMQQAWALVNQTATNEQVQIIMMVKKSALNKHCASTAFLIKRKTRSTGNEDWGITNRRKNPVRQSAPKMTSSKTECRFWRRRTTNWRCLYQNYWRKEITFIRIHLIGRVINNEIMRQYKQVELNTKYLTSLSLSLMTSHRR